MHSTPCPCSPTLPAPPAGVAQAAWRAWTRRWAAWRRQRGEAAETRAHWRALQALDRHTRRDLGLAEGGPLDDPRIDTTRSRW